MTETTSRRLRLAELNARGLYDNDGSAIIMEELPDGDSRPVASVKCQSLYKRGQGHTARCDERDALAALFIAAPDMLETLRKCLAYLHCNDDADDIAEVSEAVEDAIAEATGAKP